MPPQQQSREAQLRQELARRQELEAELQRREGGGALEDVGSDFGGGVARGFMRTQPFQNPLPAIQEMGEMGPLALTGAMFGNQLGIAESGARALFDPQEITEDPTGSLVRALKLPLSPFPGMGTAIAEDVIEPFAQSLSMRELPAGETRAGKFGEGLGGAGGFALDFGVNKMWDSASDSLRSARAGRQARETGILESLGKRENAGSWAGATESIVAHLPWGKKVMEAFRANQQRQIVERGINDVLGDMGDFTGPTAVMVNRIQRAGTNVVENLREANRPRYQQFDEALFEAHDRLPMRGQATRGQAARGTGGDEVTAIVPQSQAGASVPGAAPAGVRVTSFAGDAVADVADKIMSQVGAEKLLVRDPSLEALVGRVERLQGLRGRQVPVTIATDARSTLLELSRRLENPLGSKEGRIVGAIFDPIDEGIETALREAGGDELVSKWRTANSGVKRAHELIDDTLFEKVVQMRNPEDIASVFLKSPQMDLRRMKFYLQQTDPEKWDHVRTLILRDELAKTVTGESALPARRDGRPLRISIDPESNVTVPGNLNEAVNRIPDAKRALLLSDEEISRLSQLEGVRGRAGAADKFANLLGSQLAASAVIGIPAAAAGYAVGGLPASAIGLAAGATGGLTVGAKLAAELITHPEVWDYAMAGMKGGAGGAVAARRMMDAISDEALAEFIGVNNIPMSQLSQEIKDRLFKPSDPLSKFGMIDARNLAFPQPQLQRGPGR